MSAVIPVVEGLSVRDAALAYAGAGCALVPIRVPGKNPGSVVGAGWPEIASSDPDRVSRWFSLRGSGIALHVGGSGLVVVDVDDPDRLPEGLAAALADHSGPFQSTRRDAPRRGHYVFAQPEGIRLGNGRGGLGDGWGDVRGWGGALVVAPTPHAQETEGGQYRWVRVGAAPPLPQTLLATLTAPGGKRRPTEARGTHNGSVPGHRPLARCPSGGWTLRVLQQAVRRAHKRNKALHWASCRAGELVAAGAVSLAEAAAAMVAVGREVGLDDVEVVGIDGRSGTVYSGLRTGGAFEVGGQA